MGPSSKFFSSLSGVFNKAVDLSLKYKRVTDIAILTSYAVLAFEMLLGVPALSPLTQVVCYGSAASAGLGLASMLGAAGGELGLDGNPVKSLKTEFAKNATGFFCKQALSTGLMALAFGTYQGLIFKGGHGDGEDLFPAIPIAILAPLVGAFLGLRARKNASGMYNNDAAVAKPTI